MTILYMQHGNEYGYLKVKLFRDSDIDPLINMGWRREQPQKVEAVSEPSPDNSTGIKVDPEAGDGVPGDEQWHRNHLATMEDKDAVKAYVKQVCGKDLDGRGSLDTVKAKALDAIMVADDG